jgi:AraC-like DNA-binding protein
MDALSEVLRLSRFTGSVLADVSARGRWCIALPASPSRAFAHLMLEGRAQVHVASGEFVSLEPGDIAFLPAGTAHRVGSDGDAPPSPLASLARAAVPGDPAPVSLGSSGSRVRWVPLTFTWESHRGVSLFASLPAIVHVSLRGAAPLAWLGDSLGLSLTGSDAPRAGADASRARLAELVLIEALRRHVEGQPRGRTGWLAALGDRYVGAALALVHGRPGEDWTVERLGRQVGLSRSALAERFSVVMGEPIIGFLTRLRLELAADELLTTGHSIESVAQAAGYEAVTSFSRAFKRTFGSAPSVWRRRPRRPASARPRGRKRTAP